jgi:polysaccharide transporter, PST family
MLDASPVDPTLAVASKPLRHVGNWAAVIRNFRTLAAGEGSARFAGVAAVILTAHRLAPSDFGVVMLGLTLSAWFSMVVDAGTEAIGTREISRQPERLRELAEPMLGLRLVLSAAAVAMFAPVAWAAAQHPGDRAVLLLFALVLPATAMNLRTMVVGAGTTMAVGAGNVASQLAFFAGVAVFVQGADDLAWIPILRAAAELSYGAVIVMTLRPTVGLIRPRVDLAVWKRTVRSCAPLFANSLARVITFSSGTVLLGFLVLREDVGLYAAAHRPVVFCAAVSGVLLVSFLASYSAVIGKNVAVDIFRRTVRLAATTIPLALLVSAMSSTVVRVVYGTAYVPAGPVLALLIWVVPIVLVSGPYGVALLAAHHHGQLLRNNAVGAAFTVLVTVAGGASIGIVGAAIAAIAGQGLVAVLNYRTSVALGVAPTLDVVVLGQASTRRES